MGFSILSKELFNKKSIKNIVDGIKDYAPILNYDQKNLFDIDFDITTNIILKDYDENIEQVYDRNSSYRNHNFEERIFIKYLHVVPIIRFEEIKDTCDVIEENEDTFTVEFGRGFVKSNFSNEEINSFKLNKKRGYISQGNCKITLFFSNSEDKIKLQVYKDNYTSNEFVFMEKNINGSIDDSMNFDAPFVGLIGPLKWIVDKNTGYAICSNPIFYSELHKCQFEKSPLARFLDSNAFQDEIDVELKESYTNPFLGRKKALNLEQQINRILMGEKRIPYLVGHPGVGKTEVAKSINKNYLSFNIGTFSPDAFTGKTSIVPGEKITVQKDGRSIERYKKGSTVTAEPDWHIKLVEMSKKSMENDERCVLILDEFDKLTPQMQIYINGIVDEPRTIAGWEIPDNVDIILAGNTDEYSDASFNISGEVESRLTKIEVKASPNDWLKWASKNNVDPIIRAYIYNFPNKLVEDVVNEYGEYDYYLSLTPRSWKQKISDELRIARENNDSPDLDTYMDKNNKEDFEDFIKTYFRLGIEEILNGNFKEDKKYCTQDQIQIIINCLISTATTEEEIINSLLFIKQNNLNEYKSFFEKGWTKINNTNEDIIKFRLAKNEIGEKVLNYVK